MKKACFVIPYFGKLPSTFCYWLECCRNNPEYSWLIYTDDITQYNYPINVRVVYTTLETLKNRFEEKLGFDVPLDTPYKLCDFKSFYGYLFEEELGGYAFWGYCDFDILFGKINNFIDEKILSEYSKINYLGHLCLVKNEKEIEKLLLQSNYKEVLQDKRNRGFDEVKNSPNINQILQQNGKKIYNGYLYADLGVSHFNFHIFRYISGYRTSKQKYIPTIFFYEKGVLYQASIKGNKMCLDEILYVHFQKRMIKAEEAVSDKYILVPNEIKAVSGITLDEIKKGSKDNLIYFLINKWKRIDRAVKAKIRK